MPKPTTIRIGGGRSSVKIYGLLMNIAIAPLKTQSPGRKKKPRQIKLPLYMIEAKNKKDAIEKFLLSYAYESFKLAFNSVNLKPKITKQDVLKRLQLVSSVSVKKDTVTFIIS